MMKDSTKPFLGAFQDMLRRYGLMDEYLTRYVKHRWEDIVGPVLSKRTVVQGVKAKELRLQILSGPLRYELKNKKRELLGLIEEKVGKGVVEEITYK